MDQPVTQILSQKILIEPAPSLLASTLSYLISMVPSHTNDAYRAKLSKTDLETDARLKDFLVETKCYVAL